jgi:hypothetical protein
MLRPYREKGVCATARDGPSAGSIRSSGQPVHQLPEWARSDEVSRGVARETIRAMKERGAIAVKHGKGATVSAPSEWDVFDADVLAATLESRRGGDVLAERQPPPAAVCQLWNHRVAGDASVLPATSVERTDRQWSPCVNSAVVHELAQSVHAPESSRHSNAG